MVFNPKAILFLIFYLLGFGLNGQSLDSLQQAVEAALKMEHEPLAKADVKAIIDLADSLNRSDNKQSLFYIKKALPHTRILDDNGLTEMDAIVIYANGLIYANELDSCVSVLEKSIHKFKRESDDKIYLNKLGLLYQHLGFAFRDKSNFVKAAESFNSAATHFDRGDNQKNQLSAKYNQANLLTRLNNFKQAEESYKELLQITESPVVHGVVYNSLGILNMKQGNYSEALNFLLKNKELIDQSNEPELVYLNLGIVYRHLEKFELAEKQLLKAEEICKSKNRERTLILIYNNFVKLYYKTDKLDQAEKYLSLVEKKISPSNHTELAVMYETKSRIYEKKGDWRNAFDFLTLKQIYRDSIESIERLESITEIETKYQTEKKESENQLLKQERKLQAATIKNQKVTLFGGLIGVGLLSLLSLLFYRQNKERKKHNDLLTEKNEKIETLHKELSHRVKNNLAFVSSLMKMQGRRLENKEAKQAVKEGQTRIDAMSLLHRKLFTQEENSDINIHEYLEELCANLQHTYPFDGQKPRIQLEVEDVFMDGETGVRIGLIVNELITNSFKYAFEQQPQPLINVKLEKGKNKEIILTYKDNGIGISNTISIAETKSLGLKLISMLTKQLKGTMQTQKDNGAYFQFQFQNSKIAI